MYSNAKHDIRKDEKAAANDTSSVRTMYEYAPYPDLGGDLKDISTYTDAVSEQLKARGKVRFLDAGCGTGHLLVGTAKRFPHWTCSGLDLSNASLDVAKQLIDMHGVSADVHRGSYLEDLPFEEKSFDVIAAIGTVHHCADPAGAMKNLSRYLKDDGYLFMHMYGMRVDQEKFDIKEMLSIFEPELSEYEKRFHYYKTFVEHRKSDWVRRLAKTSPYDVYRWVKDKVYNLKRRAQKTSWSPSFREEYDHPNSPWIDHFCHPCERAYEVRDIQKLVEDSEVFEVVHMLGQGKKDKRFLPDAWMPAYEKLDVWDQWRLNELVRPQNGHLAFRMVLKKKG